MENKNIIISFDGTWNIPGDTIEGGSSTNVWKFHNLAVANNKHYEQGLGTKWYNKLRGGAFAVGLSKIIQSGYKYLIENYNEGDNVYILGFSRGAYSARSLVGLIRNAGLLLPEHHKKIQAAYELYRARDDGPDSENAKSFREKYSRNIKIHFLGVWDTVGSLGIPIKSFDWFNEHYYKFHDTELSSIVKHAYHAIAIDEHRESYAPTLWTPKSTPEQDIEQVWFIGAHSNIGGGYESNKLSDYPLLWMIEKAQACGLDFNENDVPKPPNLPNLNTEEYKIIDSYANFMKGLYKYTTDRKYRRIGETIHGKESIFPNVIDCIKSSTDYRPKNSTYPNITNGNTPTSNTNGIGSIRDFKIKTTES